MHSRPRTECSSAKCSRALCVGLAPEMSSRQRSSPMAVLTLVMSLLSMQEHMPHPAGRPILRATAPLNRLATTNVVGFSLANPQSTFRICKVKLVQKCPKTICLQRQNLLMFRNKNVHDAHHFSIKVLY